MAINLITQPDAATPTGNDDYTQQNILINGNVNQVAPDAFVLSLWESSLTVPTIKQGTYIRHAGNMYVVDSTDETISGTPAAGINYIVLAVSGTTLTATWATSYVGYTWNPAYNGWYNGTNQVVFQGVYKEGVNFISAQGVNNDPDKFRLANGDFRYLVGSVYVNNTIVANTLSSTNANITNATISSIVNQPSANFGFKLDNGSADGPGVVFASSGFDDWYIDAISGRIRFVQGTSERSSFAQADGSLTVENNATIKGNTNINAGFANNMTIGGTLYAAQSNSANADVTNTLTVGLLCNTRNLSIGSLYDPTNRDILFRPFEFLSSDQEANIFNILQSYFTGAGKDFPVFGSVLETDLVTFHKIGYVRVLSAISYQILNDSKTPLMTIDSGDTAIIGSQSISKVVFFGLI